ALSGGSTTDHTCWRGVRLARHRSSAGRQNASQRHDADPEQGSKCVSHGILPHSTVWGAPRFGYTLTGLLEGSRAIDDWQYLSVSITLGDQPVTLQRCQPEKATKRLDNFGRSSIEINGLQCLSSLQDSA